MCGRFSLTTQEDKIEKLFNVSVDRTMYAPRYNGAPTQNMAVITNTTPDQLSFLRWGLVPFWAKDPSIGARLINARAESILEKPSFKNAFKNRRCLVLSDGFYEWKGSESGKIPYRIMLKNENPFAMAGIWDSWEDGEGKILHSFSIITTQANQLVKDIHDRMPVILPHNQLDNYLQAPHEDILDLLNPYEPDEMKAYPVSKLVNNARNDTPEVLRPADYQGNELF